MSFFWNKKKAVEFATEKHEGQKRRFSEEDYVSHPLRVAEILEKYIDSPKLNEILSAAVLHDVLEDTDTKEYELINEFGLLVASLVKELTNDEILIRKVSKVEYMKEKLVGMTDWALIIKLADRLDNVSDLYNADDKFKKRYSKQTEAVLDNLEEKKILNDVQKKLIVEIRDKVKKANS